MLGKRISKVDENETGRNTKFIDNLTCQEMTRAQLVKKIEKGEYPDYHVRKINNVKTPVSNPNKQEKDNLF